MFALHFPDQTVDPAVRTLRDAGDLFLRKAPAPQIPDDDPQHAFVFLLSKSWRWIILCRNGAATPRCACCCRLDVFLVTGCLDVSQQPPRCLAFVHAAFCSRCCFRVALLLTAV